MVEGLRERKKQRTRETIVTVALELFAERGYQQTTVAEIAEAAEVSKGTVFAYFPSKEDIVFADTAPVCEDLLHQLRERPPDRSALDVLRSFMGEHVVAPDARRLLRERLIASDEQLRSHYRARLAEIEDAMAAAHRRRPRRRARRPPPAAGRGRRDGGAGRRQGSRPPGARADCLPRGGGRRARRGPGLPDRGLAAMSEAEAR